MTDQQKMDRIKEICQHYEEVLRKAERSEELTVQTRDMVNRTRHESLAEICELVRT